MDIKVICCCKSCGKRWTQISNVDYVDKHTECDSCFRSKIKHQTKVL
jgi:hypothetical protein